MTRRFLIILSLLLLPSVCSLHADEPPEQRPAPTTADDAGASEEAPPHPTSLTDQTLQAETQTVRGVVFHDENENGIREEAELGIADIRVSNGRDIVRSDAEGRYELPIDDDQIIFVIKPRNWMTHVNADQLPQFFYIHKPEGSPESRFAGVEPTGPLPESVDFALMPADEPDQFKAILFGDTQPRNLKEVDYIAHDVIDQIVKANAHDASFGVTLGDIAFDNLDTMEPLNRAIALIGIPWYNVLGNHDMNYDSPDDEHSDETFERIYGPSYYSFDYGNVHFMVLDDVRWIGRPETGKPHYVGGLGATQMEFIRSDLAMIPEDQMVVLMMHIPLVDVEDRQELYRLIEQRPFSLSISAHRHYNEHVFIGDEDGWKGPKRHHHIINVTACGSWWRGAPDELGIPHATMSDGAPNGYSVLTFDGREYSLKYHAARRPADHQMSIYAAREVQQNGTADQQVIVNFFGGSERSKVEIRFGESGTWQEMERFSGVDPFYQSLLDREQDLSAQIPEAERGTNLPWIPLPGAHQTPHLWRANLPNDLTPGTHAIQVRTTDPFGQNYQDQRSIRILPAAPPQPSAGATSAAADAAE